MKEKAPSRSYYDSFRDMYLYNSAYKKYLKENLTDDVVKDICNKIKELDRFNYGINDVKVVCRGYAYIELYRNNNKLVLKYCKKHMCIDLGCTINNDYIDSKLYRFYRSFKKAIFSIIHDYVE